MKRSIFLSCAAALTGVAMAATGQDLPAADTVRIQVEPEKILAPIADDFIGFGYETSIMAVTNYFSANNATLIRLYRNLSPHGLIRIGGNVSDHTQFLPEGTRAARADSGVTIINQDSLADLGGFVRATGWQVLWSLNLGTGTKEAAAQEAVAVAAQLGPYLHSFEIGNEVDLRGRYLNTYTNYDGYYSRFKDYHAAVLAALPQANFSGPDVANRLDWVGKFAGSEGRETKLLLMHYYRAGASQPAATIENLLQAHVEWSVRLKQLQQIGQDHEVAFRINELNSFYGGGKPGVSDTFGAALWCLDNMYLLATFGCNGVNLETDINQMAWISHYSPIFREASGRLIARPEYYGMLAFAIAGQGSLVQLAASQTGINLTAYGTKSAAGKIWVTLINKDLSRRARVEIALPSGCAQAEVYRLTAPSVASKDQITLAGAEVSPDGSWAPNAAESVPVKSGVAILALPAASAALVRLR